MLSPTWVEPTPRDPLEEGCEATCDTWQVANNLDDGVCMVLVRPRTHSHNQLQLISHNFIRHCHQLAHNVLQAALLVHFSLSKDSTFRLVIYSKLGFQHTTCLQNLIS